MKFILKTLLIIMTVAGVTTLLKCGMFQKSDSDEETSNSQYIPSDWNGLTDYEASDWTVND